MIPSELQKLNQWIKLAPGEKTPKGKDWQKHPAAWNDISEPYGKGFLLQGTPYLCIDGDHILRDGAYVTPWAESFFESMLKTGTFVERSRSGTGLHVFFKLEPEKTYKGHLDQLKAMKAKGGDYFNYYLPGFEHLPKADRPHVEVFYNATQQICLTGKSLAGGTILPPPNEVNQLLGRMPAFIEPQGGNAPAVARNDLPPDYDLQRAVAMLDYIDPANVTYNEWWQVGAVLKDLGADVALWDEWSQRDPARYKGTREIMSKWKSFTRRGGATIASLHALAKAGGYVEKDFAREWHMDHPADPADDFEDLGPAPGTIDEPDIVQVEPPNPWQDSLSDFAGDVGANIYEPIPIGIESIDDLLGGGPMKQQLIGIGAPPAMGKTALCQQIAESLARRGHRVLYFCFEMSRNQLLARGMSRLYREEMLGDLSHLDIMRGRNGWQEALSLYRDEIGGRVAYLTPGYGVTGTDLGAVKKAIMEGVKWTSYKEEPAPIVVIDYLQLLRDGAKEEMEVIKTAMDALKSYAIKFNTIVFAVMANNRASNRNKGEVIMEAGRGSSSIEYGCDALLGMAYTDALMGYKGDMVDKKRRSVVLTKGRFSAGDGRADFIFDGRYSLFEPASKPPTVSEADELDSLLL